MNKTDILESLTNLHNCLNKIEDEMETRPGEKTIRGTDAGVIDVKEVLSTVDVARSELRDIEKALA